MTTSSWQERFGQLQAFVEREGHARVPQGYETEDGVKLGHWVATQRKSYRRGKLSPERQKALESLPGWEWNARGTG